MVAVGDLAQFQGESVLKLIWIDTPERVADLREAVQAEYADLYVTTTDPEYLEFMEETVSKAAGLAIVAERLQISQNEILAFGDGNNDLTRLKWAGRGVAVGLGSEADESGLAQVTVAAPEEFGVASWLEEHVLVLGA